MPSVIHRNHLIIGLGGTGGNIIRSLRKIVYQNYRQEDPPNVNLRFLYADTSREMMDPDDPSWKILGRSVQLAERSQMYISGMNLRDVVTNLSNYPGIKPWLGSRDDWSDIINAADAANIVGGQKRRLGRFLFAGKAAEFRRRVAEFVAEMQQHQNPNFARSNDTTFHVCCGLAGGTGSGSVVDTILQIRALFPDPSYRINIYALLPERNPPAQKAGSNYHANGYAALLELNALAVGTWKPHDVTGVQGDRLDVQDPFNCCYLFNDENEANVSVSVATELPEIVASFLFQKTVEIHNIEWRETNTMLRQETFEVGSQAKYPETSAKGKPRRSRSFFSFGIKQIAYPEIEIREYLTYSFAKQSVLQLLFNKWVDGKGYQEEATTQSFNEYVKDKATLEKWYLTDERLTLSEGILKDEINNKNWKNISDFWKLIIPTYVAHVQENYKKSAPDKMLPELTRLCEAVYKEQYRGGGVTAFYETKRSDLRDQIREIRNRIETDLFAEWKNGVKSMHDISRLLAALAAAVEDRLNSMDDKIAKLGEDTDTYRENEAKITENRKQWVKPGIISTLFGKRDELVKAQAEGFIVRYTLKTRLEGYRYAKELLAGLSQELNTLGAEVSKCVSLISQASKAFQSAVDSRLVDKGNQDLTKQVVRFYEPETVRSFSKSMTSDLTEQRKQTSKVRAKLSEVLGEKQNFTTFNAKLSEARFRDILESTCEESAVDAHEEFVARHPDGGRVLQVSLIDMLQKEYDGSDERLRSYAQSIIAMAKNYLRFDQSQVQLVAPGIPAANDDSNAICVSNLTIIAPEAPEANAFRTKFCTALRNATTSATQVVTNKQRPQEITLISITNVFPARFVSVLDFLRRKYDDRVLGPQGKRAFLELHSEGSDGKVGEGQEFPSLYPESYKASDLYPWMLLGNALDLVRMEKDPKTGIEKCYFVTTDADGFPIAEELGSSVDQVIQNADVATFETVQTAIEPLLKREYLHVDKRQELLEKMRGKVMEIAKVRPATDPVFQEMRTALTKAKDILGIA